MEYTDFIKSAAHVVPSARQLAWYETQFYAFVHFTVNTYTDLEWGLGTEDENIFNPTELDCDQWVEAVKSAGMKGIILTAKHHDGFCLWQTKTTPHSVKSSRWRNGNGDVVKECAEACRRGGIKFGVYLSPWDRNCPLYGTPAYNDFYVAQLTELMTNYGELFMVWFDNACGEGPNGRRQEYDFHRYIETVRKYQSNACIFNDFGPDVRWCGNEAGIARRAEWAVVPYDLCPLAEKQTQAGPRAGSLEFLCHQSESIGELHVIQYASGLVFCGAEIDMSIRPGWFYHEYEKPHSLERLVRTYINSCAANTSFNLNIPPMPNGKFHPDDVTRLKELGVALHELFGKEKQVPYTREDIEMGTDGTQRRMKLKLPEVTDIAYIELKENIANGQRVEHFRIMSPYQDGSTSVSFIQGNIFEGYTIGNRKICQVNAAPTDEIEVQILAARDTVEISDIIIYKK